MKRPTDLERAIVEAICGGGVTIGRQQKRIAELISGLEAIRQAGELHERGTEPIIILPYAVWKQAIATLKEESAE